MVLSLALAAPAFAAKPQAFPQTHISLSSDDSVGPFAVTPGGGKYLQVWFRNFSGAEVTVMLMDESSTIVLKAMTVKKASGAQNKLVYPLLDPDLPVKHHIRFQAEGGAQVVGDVAAAQYDNLTVRPGEGETAPLVRMPVRLFENGSVNERAGTYETDEFTTTPGNGKYIKVWYENKADHDVTISLHREDRPDYVDLMTVKANGGTNVIWCPVSDTEPVSCHIRYCGKNSYPVLGHLRVTEEAVKTN